ncbi:MAG: metallophosphoesterase [Ruminococcus sp.]|nr:metallophosphoesterase [Ruminococcus sp.]
MKKLLISAIVFAVLISSCCYLHFENTSMQVSKYEVGNAKIPSEFDGFKIAQISDFHNTQSERLKSDLISEIKSQNPNLIVLTGDLIDSRRTDVDCAADFVKNITSVAPTYYIPGNHESRVSEYEALKEQLTKADVTILENSVELISKGDAQINLAGIIDPAFVHESMVDDRVIIETEIKSLKADKRKFTILLSHRPEVFDAYCKQEVDLVFSGHAHGGQIRIPFIGGVVAPNQGFFPKYTSGKFESSSTAMIVSRGIGNSIFPFRINNRPELVVVTLKDE